ncbi:MAG TPA: hypothetical protein VJN95_06395 [Gemmatimonadales bacterium]|nr:hypothetical protein [Gemmatimonadales bacterium]
MTAESRPAMEAARRLWVRASGGGTEPEVVAAALERLCGGLSEALGRWIGSEGYHALLDRALALARLEHPVLRGLSALGGEEGAVMAEVRSHGAEEVVAGLVALVATLIGLLGRIIGEDLAAHLVEQISVPSPRGAVSSESRGGRHG